MTKNSEMKILIKERDDWNKMFDDFLNDSSSYICICNTDIPGTCLKCLCKGMKRR